MRITEEEYRDYEDSSMGYCPDCDDFTRDCTEPDAEEYDCPVCDGQSVMGAMNAMMSEVVEIE